ncbi:MAG: DNA repair exonuclease [Gemmatimonadales bacterium]
MRLAHLADIHLGFRQYHRLTSGGVNQREADVALAFRQTVDGVIAAHPDLVLVAGDLFNSVRPSNPAILHAFHQFQRLRAALPQTPLVIVAGNHDSPRSIETGTILRLFEAVPGVHIVVDDVQDLEFRELDLIVTCVPHEAWRRGAQPTAVPGGGAGRRVLVTHSEVAGVIPRDASAVMYGGAVVEPSDLHLDRWDYVALGHYHVTHRVAENAWYAGAVEYVSSNPWGELKDEARAGREGAKGWLLVELGDEPSVTFQRVALARRVIDLPPVQGAGLDAATIDARLASHVDGIEGGLDDQIVRQVVYDVPRPIGRELDYATIRGYKTRALHYQLDLRRPERRREVGVGAPGRRQTLTDIVSGYLRRRPIDADVSRDRLVALGEQYMRDVAHELDEA